MILDLILILFFQPFFLSIFVFLAPLLFCFFFSKLKELNFKIFIYSFLMDLLFIKPLGFFLLVSSSCFLLLSLLEKFLSRERFYERMFFLLIFNILFLLGFLFLSSSNLNFQSFLKIVFFNFLFQLIYLQFRRFVFKR